MTIDGVEIDTIPKTHYDAIIIERDDLKQKLFDCLSVNTALNKKIFDLEKPQPSTKECSIKKPSYTLSTDENGSKVCIIL